MAEPVRIVVDSRIRLPSNLAPDVTAALKEAFTHKNPQYAKLRAMGYKSWEEKPFDVTYVVSGESLSLPRGGMERVRSVLREHGRAWTVDDRRVSLPCISVPPLWRALYPDQVECVNTGIKYENCLIKSPTGSGKTTAAIGMIAKVQQPTLIVVWNTGLLTQWVERLEAELHLDKRQIGVIRGARTQVRPISVAMQQTVARLPTDQMRIIQSSFGMVVCDEVQRFAARTFASVIDKMPARYRIGISADETRKDKKEYLIYDRFGKVVSDVSQKRLVEDGRILSIEVRIIPTEFRAPWYILQQSNKKRRPDFHRLLAEMTSDADRNGLAIKVVKGEVERGAQVLVFSHRVEHCKSLDSTFTSMGIKSGLLLGTAEWADTFNDTVARIKRGEKRVGVGTVQAIGQGLDLPSVSRGVVTTHLTNNRQLWGQVRGRLCRVAEGKTDAVIYYLWDQHVFDLGPVANLIKWNERSVVLEKGQWVDAKAWLARTRKERKDGREDSETDWIFD